MMTRDDRIQTRPAVEGDLEQVIALDERATGIGKPDYLRDLFERYSTRRIEERFFYVAETRSALAGFVIGEIRAWEFGSESCGWVFALSVDPEHREGGVGTALLDRISESFTEAGVSRLRTMISRDNHLLMAFFRSHGLTAGPYLQLEMDLT